MIRSTHSNIRGFSLIEVLVYLAVTVLVSTASVMTLLSLDTTLLRNSTERSLTNAATVSLERISREIRASAEADVTVPGKLTLTAPPDGGGLGAATTTSFTTSGGNVVVAVNGVEIGPLTTDDVTVEDLTFTKYTNLGGELETELVRAALTLSVSNKAASTTKTYYTSAVLRGTYE